MIYLGRGHNGEREVFTSEQTPSRATHGVKYACVIGPFRTRLAAEMMRDYGENNPLYQCVADAERIARHVRKHMVWQMR